MRRHRFAVALVALIAVTLVLTPLIRGEVFTFRDHSDYFQPLRFFTAGELRAGHLPLWNPYNASGEPWLANPQTGVFYPPAWLFLVLSFPRAYLLYLALHLAILGWGAYALFERDAAPGAAVSGAAMLLLCGPVLSLLDVSNTLATLAWLPWVLWSARTRSPLASMFLALSFLAGEPFFAGLGALLYVAIVRDVREVFRRGLAAAGICAVQLLPFFELLRGSDRRAGLTAAEIFRDSMTWHDWTRIAIWPGIHADGFDPALGQHFIPIVYVGTFVILLAITGLLVGDRRRVGAWSALLVVCMFVSCGPALLASLPLTLFRYPARLVPVGALCVVALAVAGWDRFRPQKRWADLLLIGVLVLDAGPVITPLLTSGRFDPHVVRYPAKVGQGGKIVRLEARDRATLARNRTAWMAGYLNLFDRRFDAWTAAPVVAQTYVDFYEAAVARADRRSIDALAARWFLSTDALPEVAFIPYRRAGPVTVYEYKFAQTMVQLLTGDGKVVPASAVAFGTSSAAFETEWPVSSVAVISQQDAPGWTVTVDGRAAGTSIPHGIFRSVRLPPGHHRVVWRYRPRMFTAGASITVLTLLSELCAMLFVKFRAHKNFLHATR